VRRLEVFHFSPRYQGMAQAFHTEARTEYTGETRLENEMTWAADLVDEHLATPVAEVATESTDGGRP